MDKISEIFAYELSLLKDKDVRDLVEYLLDNKVPHYFLTNKSSSSGTYHPLNKNGDPENLVEHSKSVFRILFTILDHPDIKSRYSESQIAVALAASIMHDSVKYGFDENCDHTVFEHPIYVKFLLDDKIESNENWLRIFIEMTNLISTHHGPWITSKYSDLILPKIETEMQWYLHLADYIASRTYIRVDYDFDSLTFR